MSKCRYDLSEDCHNKDCLKCVLDKIRAEINSCMSIPFEQFNQHDESAYDKGLARALFIIDKYREEQE